MYIYIYIYTYMCMHMCRYVYLSGSVEHSHAARLQQIMAFGHCFSEERAQTNKPADVRGFLARMEEDNEMMRRTTGSHPAGK